MRRVNNEFRNNINYHHIKQSVAIRVERKLKNDIKIPYDKFYDFLHKYNVSICGSFLLQCILDETFEDSLGIDLLINNDPSDIFDSFKLIQGEYQESRNHFYKLNKYFAMSDHHIRIINTDVPKLEFIQTMTSFDVCKNLYDTKNIYISDLNAIINKKEGLKNVFDPDSKTYPCVYKIDKLVRKYVNRGFEFKKMIIPNIHTKNILVIVYTKTHFMYDENMYMRNDKNVCHRGIYMYEIFNIIEQHSGKLECADEGCIHKTIYDMNHLHKFQMVSALGGIFITLIPYVSCGALINFKKLEMNIDK